MSTALVELLNQLSQFGSICRNTAFEVGDTTLHSSQCLPFSAHFSVAVCIPRLAIVKQVVNVPTTKAVCLCELFAVLAALDNGVAFTTNALALWTGYFPVTAVPVSKDCADRDH